MTRTRRKLRAAEMEKKMPDAYARRRAILRRTLQERGLDALLVSKAANRFYLSGFELHDAQCDESSGRLVIGADGQDWLATDSRYEEAAARIWPRDRLFIYGANQAQDICGLLARLGQRVGIEQDCVSARFMRQLMGCAGHPHFFEADGIVEKFRMIKSPEEVEALEKSFDLNHRLLEYMANGLQVGVSEREAAWRIEKFFRENGASELAFSSIVAIGPNAALPHAVPGDARISDDCLVLLDVGCRVENYCSDQTRTFWMGQGKSGMFEKTRALVQAAQDAALAAIRPGIACAEVYRVAREIFEAAGQAVHFNHGLGHGVGLQTHEAPSLSPRSRQILEKGMVVTVEPGLYYPGWGGVRLEVTVLVEDDGCRIF